MIEYHFIEQGSEQWRADRVGFYTGSGAYKLLGSFGAQAYAQAIEDSFRGNFWTKRGHILEDEAIEIYEQIKKVNIIRNDEGIKVGFITNSDYPSCKYSPDGVTEKALLEVKCFDEKQHMKLIRGDIDLKILAQIHFGLLMSKLPFADLIPYNPEIENPKEAFAMIRIKRNRDIENNFKRILGGAVHVS